MATKPKFDIISKPVEIKGSAGNVYLISRQMITQDNGTASEHLVINKIKRNADGSQNFKKNSDGSTDSKPKQVFIDIKSVKPVIEALNNLLK